MPFLSLTQPNLTNHVVVVPSPRRELAVVSHIQSNMKNRVITIPDSEDDVPSSGTSLRNYSALPRRTSQRLSKLSSSARNPHVIPDSEDDFDDQLDLPSTAAHGTQHASGRVEVVIPVKKNASESPYDSASRSSLSLLSVDGATGNTTPATSIGLAAPESDTKKPRTRVNASDRAQQLRSSTLSSSNPPLKKIRSLAEMPAEVDREATDAALAKVLQMKEYAQPYAKKRKTFGNPPYPQKRMMLGNGKNREMQDAFLTDEELGDSDASPLSSDFDLGSSDSSSSSDSGDDDLRAAMNRGAPSTHLAMSRSRERQDVLMSEDGLSDIQGDASPFYSFGFDLGFQSESDDRPAADGGIGASAPLNFTGHNFTSNNVTGDGDTSDEEPLRYSYREERRARRVSRMPTPNPLSFYS